MFVKRTKIGYADFSGGDLNFVIGCTSAGIDCKNCYARALLEGRFNRDFSKVQKYETKVAALRNADFSEKGVVFRRGPESRPLCFVCDLSDLFHHHVSLPFIDRAFRAMADRQDVDWLVLTKRPWRLLDFQREYYPEGIPSNIWIGLSIGTQKVGRQRYQYFRQVKASLKFLSLEPLLEAIDLGALGVTKADIAWVIVGGESGSCARPFDVAWAESAYAFCKERGVAFFGKQRGGLYPGMPLFLKGKQGLEFPR